MELPNEDCDAVPEKDECGKHEYSCGDGQCVHGLAVCDRQRDCSNWADEREW